MLVGRDVRCCLGKVEHVCLQLIFFGLVRCFGVRIVVCGVCCVGLQSWLRRLCGGTYGGCEKNGFNVACVTLLVRRLVWLITLGVRMCSWEQCLAWRGGWRFLVRMSAVLLSDATPPIRMPS